MAYDGDFYKMYEDYLAESGVRDVHDDLFEMFSAVCASGSPHILDLGCGRSQEYKHQGYYADYLGFDLNAEDPECKIDYRNPEFTHLVDQIVEQRRDRHNQVWAFPPGAFVSLFSSEITASEHENRLLYEGLFRHWPIQTALVSGFYYTDKKDQVVVPEEGGIESFQTLSSLEESDVSLLYKETRITVACPSKLFGPNVVEVWRILTLR